MSRLGDGKRRFGFRQAAKSPFFVGNGRVSASERFGQFEVGAVGVGPGARRRRMLAGTAHGTRLVGAQQPARQKRRRVFVVGSNTTLKCVSNVFRRLEPGTRRRRRVFASVRFTRPLVFVNARVCKASIRAMEHSQGPSTNNLP